MLDRRFFVFILQFASAVEEHFNLDAIGQTTCNNEDAIVMLQGRMNFREEVQILPVAENKVIEGAPNVGAYGGSCTCPDGTIYQVGDKNDWCGSLACVGGTAGKCNKKSGSWSNRKVECAPLYCEFASDTSAPTNANCANDFVKGSLEDCHRSCSRCSTCEGFHFHTTDFECVLKKNVDALSRSFTDFRPSSGWALIVNSRAKGCSSNVRVQELDTYDTQFSKVELPPAPIDVKHEVERAFRRRVMLLPPHLYTFSGMKTATTIWETTCQLILGEISNTNYKWTCTCTSSKEAGFGSRARDQAFSLKLSWSYLECMIHAFQ